ncbi:uncharacterized protein OCT59_022162 [Rhizophagus irregularis]|uniref:Uncharacterized protein n=1 Tax=Rhizophagus irregularis TaxID=588596 RepID=A0A915Z6R3_9GLOM|nr:hypothetical protein OCT59_022162 [Rhizophagus irregularis]CAB5364908.1 unnamed protein product [Rhizophagus irregularis]
MVQELAYGPPLKASLISLIPLFYYASEKDQQWLCCVYSCDKAQSMEGAFLLYRLVIIDDAKGRFGIRFWENCVNMTASEKG